MGQIAYVAVEVVQVMRSTFSIEKTNCKLNHLQICGQIYVFNVSIDHVTRQIWWIWHLLPPWWVSFGLCDLEMGWMTLKNNLHLFYASLSSVYPFIAVSWLKLMLSFANVQIWSIWSIFRPVWPWNLTDDIEIQQGNSSMPLKVMCVIS